MACVITRTSDAKLRTPVPSSGLGLRVDASGCFEFLASFAEASAVVLPASGGAVLVLPPDTTSVFVNGVKPLGVTMLTDRDELLLDGAQLWFGERAPLAAAPFPPDRGPATCGVCSEAIGPGDAAITCDGCRTAHHAGAFAAAERGSRDCFVYRGSTCAGCGRAGEDDSWLPEDP